MSSHQLLVIVPTGLVLGLVLGIMIDYYKPKRLLRFLRRLGLFNRD